MPAAAHVKGGSGRCRRPGGRPAGHACAGQQDMRVRGPAGHECAGAYRTRVCGGAAAAFAVCQDAAIACVKIPPLYTAHVCRDIILNKLPPGT